MKIYKTIEWDMGHRIPNHRSQCRHLHGHRYRLEVCLQGKLIDKANDSSEGMVMDFGEVKEILNCEVKDVCDHAFMVWKNDKKLISFFKKNPDMKHVTVSFIPTAEEICRWLFNKLNKRFKDKFKTGLKLTEVIVWETPSSRASYDGK